MKSNILLFESFNTQNELESLTYKILDYMSNYIVIKKTMSVKNILSHIDKKYDTIQDFIDNFNLDINIKLSDGRGQASYVTTSDIFEKNKGDINLFLYDYEIEEFKNEKDSNMLLHNLLKFFRYELLHELQHAYDDYRTNSKFINNDGIKFLDKQTSINDLKDKINKGLYLTKDELQNKKDYTNLKHEIDARFTEAISRTHFYDMDMKTFKKVLRSFNDIKTDFIKNIRGFDIMDHKDKKRVLRKLGQFYIKSKEILNN